MKSIFTKISSIFLAVFILFSTSSFAVNMHFCCNQMVDMAFLGQAEICKDKVQKEDSPIKQCTTLQAKDCCSSQTFVKEGDDTFKKCSPEIETETLVFLNRFVFIYINLFEGLEENVVRFKTYKPPLLFEDIQLLNETFLI
ncbi:hypothetical protein JM83_3883 [Gillisia sp. Hel_I_86]|uniref:HYC_CC_PP family protein n=1 Tax=Gillisia sp. Hel_I_86 TaxID=1249981 RepID=UPI00119A94B4|nr:hypothetical protein [Gillisia sp. Hel_I_86]TVZ28734.1 hypothetical protein JM83_3883 [Gillisia sp. Hel_I_86]